MNNFYENKNAWVSWENEVKEKRERQKRLGVLKYSFSKRKNVITVSTALKKWKQSVSPKSKLLEAEIGTRWDEIVGSRIAENTVPLELKYGRLLLRVKDSVWRHQLHFLKEEMVEKINKALETEAVREIVLTG